MTRGDEGFTLVELMIGTVLTAIIGALLFGTLVSGQQSERHLEEIAASQEDLRRALVEITRDIRAAEPLWFKKTVSPLATPDKELRLEHWEVAAAAPTYIRWHISGGELVRDIVELDSAGTTLQTVATTYRLTGVDPTLTGFAYSYPTPVAPYEAEVDITPGRVEWRRLNHCANKVFVELRAATLRGRHPTSVRGEINLRNHSSTPGYC